MNAITVKCPDCARELQHEGRAGDDVICPSCGHRFIVPLKVKLPPRPVKQEPAEVPTTLCVHCKSEVRVDASRCKWCGGILHGRSPNDQVEGFENLITPMAVSLIYWAGAVVLTAALVFVFGAAVISGEMATASVALASMLFANVGWRLACESMFILYAIYGELRSMNRR